MATVVAGTLLPASAGPLVALSFVNDKVLHFAAYALLAFLPSLHESRSTVGALAGLMISVGAGLEFAQLYSPGRTFEPLDILANALGVFCGLALGLPLRL